jgi:hypothetical protein
MMVTKLRICCTIQRGINRKRTVFNAYFVEIGDLRGITVISSMMQKKQSIKIRWFSEIKQKPIFYLEIALNLLTD